MTKDDHGLVKFLKSFDNGKNEIDEAVKSLSPLFLCADGADLMPEMAIMIPRMTVKLSLQLAINMKVTSISAVSCSNSEGLAHEHKVDKLSLHQHLRQIYWPACSEKMSVRFREALWDNVRYSIVDPLMRYIPDPHKRIILDSVGPPVFFMCGMTMIGDNKSAKRLRTLVKILPFAIPLYRHKELEGRWFVATA